MEAEFGTMQEIGWHYFLAQSSQVVSQASQKPENPAKNGIVSALSTTRGAIL